MFNFRWLQILERSVSDCLRRRKHSQEDSQDSESRPLSKPKIKLQDKSVTKIPGTIFSYHSIRTLLRLASPVILSSMLPTTSASKHCEKIYYFSAPMNVTEQKLYAVQVISDFMFDVHGVCNMVEKVLYQGGCGITALEYMKESLTGIIAGCCDDYYLFPTKRIMLSAVNNTLLTITTQLKCVLDNFEDKCYGFDYYIENIIGSIGMLCLIILAVGIPIRICDGGLKSLNNYNARKRAEAIQDELFEHNPYRDDPDLALRKMRPFQNLNSPLLLIAQYANEDIVPPRFRNMAVKSAIKSMEIEVTDQGDDLTPSIPNTSAPATASTPLLQFGM